MREFRLQFHAGLGRIGPAILQFWRRSRPGATGDSATDPRRVYLFAGDFVTEAEMFAYCFAPVASDGPEQLNLDLPSAPIDTDLVEAVFRDQIVLRLPEYFGPKARRRILGDLAPGEALILVPTEAFSGSEFELHDTPVLRHLGFETCLPTAVWSLYDKGAP